MHININKEMKNGDFYVIITSENLDTVEFEKAIEKFGKIEENLGGTFYETIETEVETVDEATGDVTVTTETKQVEVFKFAEKIVEINSEINYERAFKVAQYGENAKRYANIYGDTIYERLNSALDELRSATDDFSSDDKDLFF